jgi:hypothetical protein
MSSASSWMGEATPGHNWQKHTRGGGIILCSFPRCEGRIPDHAACDAPRYIPRSSASCSEHYPKTAAKITIFGPCEESAMSDSMSADPKPQNVKLENIMQATADLPLKLPSQVFSGHFQALVGRRSLSCAWRRHPKAPDFLFLSNNMEAFIYCWFAILYIVPMKICI